MNLKTNAMILLLVFISGIALANTKIPANPYKKPKQAFNYVYSRVVKQHNNDAWAEYLLGSYYEKAYGTKVDLVKSYVWYKMSANNEYKPAIAAFERLKKSLSNKQIKASETQYTKASDDLVKGVLSDMRYMTTH